METSTRIGSAAVLRSGRCLVVRIHLTSRGRAFAPGESFSETTQCQRLTRGSCRLVSSRETRIRSKDH
ncbi:hypothetical protein KC361_g281 [Hortaea werneckii]|nr:hypothetical protein KC361_g281 [Hortaea werneckii]